MRVTNLFAWTCENCEHSFTTNYRTGLTLPTCPSCGLPVNETPDGEVLIQDGPNVQGFYECFDCGHTFGYASTGLEDPYAEPDCPQCGSESVKQV